MKTQEVKDVDKYRNAIKAEYQEAWDERWGVLVAITTTDQTTANEALKAEGFVQSDRLHKGENAYGTELYVWYRSMHNEEGEPV
jgi:hypothetical protein